ncbi:MAG: DNA replication protein [Alphaproteobacteria bacterium]|nr:DNA replication protein [Alphaproteobacteria bacterium]
MTQFLLEMPPQRGFDRTDFLVSRCNAAALAWIDRWPDWPGNALVLYGPPGCGKTHLAHIWRARSAAAMIAGERLPPEGPLSLPATALAIDSADRAPETALLHLFNFCRERGGSVLVVTQAPPASWPIRLPALASRLRAALAVGIDPPDEALLGSVLLKQLADRRVAAAPEVVRYLLARMERSFAAAAALADRLDRAALGRRRREISIPMARRILAEATVQPSSPPSDFGVA